MKIAILNITGGGMSGGYKKYLLNIIPRLASNGNIKSLLCVSPGSLNVNTWFKPFPNVEFVNCSPFDFYKYGFDRKLKQKITQFSPDLVFIPVARCYDLAGVPALNMVQNIFPFLRKNVQGLSFIEMLRLTVQYFESVRALKRAKRIIVTSNFIKDYLIEKEGISSEKMSLVYFGKDPDTKNAVKPDSIPSGLAGKFLFTAGSIETYRGLEDIIEALKCLKKDFPNLKVVIAGKARASAKKYHERLLELCKTYDLTRNIIWAGQLDQAKLAWCYRNCAAFIMTSRMETFGMIALEAMAGGCLCIASDNPPLPEIFSDAAYYYSPEDPRSLADVINKVLALDIETKMKMKNKAKDRSEYFTWDKAVDGLINEFKIAIKS